MITFYGTRAKWLDKGIMKLVDLGMDIDISTETREWLNEHVGTGKWKWDYYREESETEISFAREKDAILFKITWL